MDETRKGIASQPGLEEIARGLVKERKLEVEDLNAALESIPDPISRQLFINLVTTLGLDALEGEARFYLANQAKEAYEASRKVVENLEDVATIDPRTKLYNRRHLNDKIERELSALVRDPNYTFSLIIIDIDHFKNFNDRYGHNAGDTVLKKIAEVLGASSRRAHTSFRYGGEEFVVVLDKNTGLDEACNLAYRLKKEISANPLSFSVGNEEKNSETITASFGVAEINRQDLPLMLLYGENGREVIGAYLMNPEGNLSIIDKDVSNYINSYDRVRGRDSRKTKKMPPREELKEAIIKMGDFVRNYYTGLSINPFDKPLGKLYPRIGFEWVLEKADNALYHSKKIGRDSVTYFSKKGLKIFTPPVKK